MQNADKRPLSMAFHRQDLRSLQRRAASYQVAELCQAEALSSLLDHSSHEMLGDGVDSGRTTSG